MHFSTTTPPAPSLLIFVTKGPALLVQEVKVQNTIMLKNIFFIVYNRTINTPDVLALKRMRCKAKTP
jgi:hypothetical protein